MPVSHDHVFELLRHHFQHHGYWTVMVMVLLENMGVPVPAEMILLFASFLAYSEHQLRLSLIIPIVILAAVLGDNAGYAVGYFGGRRVIDKYLHLLHVPREAIQKGELFFKKHGPVTVFLARFITGMRTIAGPLAGTLGMPWTKFVLFNFLGAAVWGTATASIGYLLGSQLDRAVRIMAHANVFIVASALCGAIVWFFVRNQATRLRNQHLSRSSPLLPSNAWWGMRRPQSRQRTLYP